MHLLRDFSIIALLAVAACKGSNNQRSGEQGQTGTGQTGSVAQGQGGTASSDMQGGA